MLLFASEGLIFFAAKIISDTPARIATSTRKVRFIAQTPCSQSKPVQKRKISRNHVEAPHYKQYAQHYQQRAAGYFQRVHMSLEAFVEDQKPLNPQRCQQERHRQAHRINGQQPYALENGVLLRRKGQDYCQYRPYAGRPTKGKSETNHQRAPWRRSTFNAMQPFIRV